METWSCFGVKPDCNVIASVYYEEKKRTCNEATERNMLEVRTNTWMKSLMRRGRTLKEGVLISAVLRLSKICSTNSSRAKKQKTYSHVSTQGCTDINFINFIPFYLLSYFLFQRYAQVVRKATLISVQRLILVAEAILYFRLLCSEEKL